MASKIGFVFDARFTYMREASSRVVPSFRTRFIRFKKRPYFKIDRTCIYKSIKVAMLNCKVTLSKSFYSYVLVVVYYEKSTRHARDLFMAIPKIDKYNPLLNKKI